MLYGTKRSKIRLCHSDDSYRGKLVHGNSSFWRDSMRRRTRFCFADGESRVSFAMKALRFLLSVRLVKIVEVLAPRALMGLLRLEAEGARLGS